MSDISVSKSGLPIQINVIDSYQTSPSALDIQSYQDEPLNQVPVIRIFGTTASTDANVCLHVHGVFPYIFVPYEDDLSHLDQVINNMYVSINAEMSYAFKRTAEDKTSFVANIVLCKGSDIYGFHAGWQLFLKIYLTNPSYVSKCSNLLQTGKIIPGKRLQTYESHITYLSQFFADCNLYGCGTLRIAKAYYREKLPNDDATTEIYEKLSLNLTKVLNLQKMAHCDIEMDITADMILNRKELVQSALPASNLSRSELSTSDVKVVSSLNELWLEDTNRRLRKGLPAYKDPDDFSLREPMEVQWSRHDEHVAQANANFFTTDDEIRTGSYEIITYDSVPTIFDVAELMFKPKRLTAGDTREISATLSQPLGEDEYDIDEDFEEPRIPDSQEEDDPDMFLTDFEDHGEVPAHIKNSPFKDKRQKLKHFKGASYEDSEDQEEHEDDVDDLQTVRNLMDELSREKELLDVASEPSSPTPSNKRIKITSQDLYSSQSFRQSLKSSQEFLKSFSTPSRSNLQKIASYFRIKNVTTLLSLAVAPPTKPDVDDGFSKVGLPSVIYKKPFYGFSKDIPEVPYVHAGVKYKILGNGVETLANFHIASETPRLTNFQPVSKLFRYALEPPSKESVKNWLEDEQKNKASSDSATHRPQESAANNFNGGGSTDDDEFVDKQMSILELEVHVNTVDGRFPDPEKDKITALFWKFAKGDTPVDLSMGIMISVEGTDYDAYTLFRKIQLIVGERVLVQVFKEELQMIDNLILLVRYHDPDILSGYEIISKSWGYVIERHGGLEFTEKLSRTKSFGTGKVRDRWGYTHGASAKVTGRHMLNIWRTLRHEITIATYTFEHVMWSLLNERVPYLNQKTLSDYFMTNNPDYLSLWAKYYIMHITNDLRIIDNVGLVTRHSEQARIIGIDYYSVISRGSQFKVESLLSRVARQENFLLISPTKQQVGDQDALSHIPLVMEPESGLYNDPILVLDFQSLYPSIIIAYNYCYSTCLGRVTQNNRLGIKDNFRLPKGLFHTIQEKDIFLAPNGLAYLKPYIRKSILAKMLEEILETRVMVKEAMKHIPKSHVAFRRKMNNTQLALKLFANVTYGYVSASYSGRMPCSEIADSIVLTGRETLEKAISTIQNTAEWNARVVYGDTDSLFVLLPGRSREEAFQLGNVIAETITKMNPAPIKLKFEKVYHPGVMLTKKRYTGYSYETPEQKEPFFDAKGTETVRRDGTPAQQRIEQRALETLFKTNDFSKVKLYLQQEWFKLMSGDISVKDYCFSKEVKMGTYKAATLPPAAAIAARKMVLDPRAEPQYKERVSFLVVAGPPKSRLVDRCVTPEEYLNDANMVLDAEYYISRHIIPPLERIFNTMGANIRQWYNEMPKSHVVMGNNTLKDFLQSAVCTACKVRIAKPPGKYCDQCALNPAHAVYMIESRLKKHAQNVLQLNKICRQCSGLSPIDLIDCTSEDCEVYYARMGAISKLTTLESMSW